MSKQPLIQRYTMHDLELKNRVVMAPMTRSRADNPENAPTDLHVEYYKQRAGAGLIISEGSQVSTQGVGYINTAGIHNKAQVEGWKKVTDAVHAEGGKIFIQLWHVGRISHPDFHGGNKPVAPSAINPGEKAYTPEGFKETVEPHALETQEVEAIVQDFKKAAENAKEAGFDGVEIHSSNGYLFHQFFSRTSNHRTDKYGGSIENRARFLFEVLDEVKQVFPEGRIGIRLNPSLDGIFGMETDEETIPTFDYIVKKVSDEYDLAYLHLSEPFTDVSDKPHLVSEIAKHYRPMYKGTLMINGGFDREKGNRFIEEGLADLVSYAKLYISNPDLAKRFELEAPLAEWDQDTFYTPGPDGYTDYPFLAETEVNKTYQ
ncbi:alkene reductase [Roseivirga sp. BDSF3-8]|uniref:alkene reductase n=1 Tax=Roseivirga sp. BDSF3-8 TaxID=3241598 RepID=UPI003531FD7B